MAESATYADASFDVRATNYGAGGSTEGTTLPFTARGEGSPKSGAGVYSVEEDPEVNAAANSLRTGRLGYRFAKRLFDIVFSMLVVAVLAIPMALICLAIRFDSVGSPVYSQERVGKDGKIIKVLKLRSMYVDADDVEKYLDAEQLDQWRRERKVDNDPRITKIGRFVRSTSIDEIPQFLNVLAGQLSVIGPRPITTDELDQHFAPQQRRNLLSVRPGITGKWQAGERNGATFETGRRQRIELSYIREASLGEDARIFFATFGAMFGKGKTGR